MPGQKLQLQLDCWISRRQRVHVLRSRAGEIEATDTEAVDLFARLLEREMYKVEIIDQSGQPYAEITLYQRAKNGQE